MSPVVWLTLAFAAGDLAGLFLKPSWPAAAGLVCAGTLALLPGARVEPAGRWIVVAFVLLGAGFGGLSAGSARRDWRALLADGRRIAIEGRFDGIVAPDTTAFLVAETVRTGASVCSCTGTIRVRVPARAWQPVALDAHVRVTGRWWAQPPGRLPVSPERSGSLAVDSLMSFVVSGHSHPLLRMRGAMQQRIRAVFGSRSGLAEALLLARREALDPVVRQRFVDAGLAHMLAISGAHVGVIAATLLLLARLAGLSAKVGAICAVSGTTAYVLFLGAPYAAARAGLQAALLLMTKLTQRPADPIGLLAAAGLALLATDGLALLDAGFQLSFAGMYGIIAWRKPILRVLRDHVPRPVSVALATSLAATLATAPVAALHFGTVASVGVVATLVAAPLLGLCIPAIALSLAAGLASPSTEAFLAGGGRLLLMLLDETARLAAHVPGGHGVVSWTAVGAGLTAVLAFVLSARVAVRASTGAGPAQTRRARRVRWSVRATIAVTAWSVFPLIGGRGSGLLEIYAIDVGQGDAIAIRSPAGRWLLVDTGPGSDRFDAGRTIVVPFLLRNGVQRLDALVLTHPDADHIGGAQSVLQRIDVGLIIDPGIATGKDSFLALLATARQRRIPWIAGRAGREIHVDGVTLRFLAPDESALDASLEANDYSLIFRLEYGRFSVLFTGDAPRSVENRVVARAGPALASTVLKVGHHGSRTSTGDSVLAAVRPAIALLSVGRHNRYGHPHPDVLERLQESGVQVMRTDVAGTLAIRAHADGRIRLGVSR